MSGWALGVFVKRKNTAVRPMQNAQNASTGEKFLIFTHNAQAAVKMNKLAMSARASIDYILWKISEVESAGFSRLQLVFSIIMLGMSVGGKMFVFSRFIIDPQFLMFLERFYSYESIL